MRFPSTPGLSGPTRYFACVIVLMMMASCRAPRRTRMLDGSIVPGPATIEVIAHRGAHTDRPQNTLPAIQGAIELGLDWVEIDVRQTRDGACVLMHNRDVGATTNGSGEVSAMSLQEVRALDAGSYRGEEWAGTRVPILEEALALMSGKIGVYLDLKEAPAEEIVRQLRSHDMLATALVYSGYSEEMRKVDALIRLLPEYPGRVDLVSELVSRTGADTIAISKLDRLTPEAVAACHAANAKVFVDLMQDDTPDGVADAVACGVDGIQTDHPEMVLEELRRIGRHR